MFVLTVDQVDSRQRGDRVARPLPQFADRWRGALTVPAEAPLHGSDAEAVADLLLELPSRRSPEGWAVAEGLTPRTTQAAVAQELGVTAQAVGLRAKAAGIRLEARAPQALVRALAALDGGSPLI